MVIGRTSMVGPNRPAITSTEGSALRHETAAGANTFMEKRRKSSLPAPDVNGKVYGRFGKPGCGMADDPIRSVMMDW